MIEAKNLSFSYGSTKVLQGISLKLEEGRFYAVIGTNGSGKTTLLNCLARLRSGSGELKMDGIDYRNIKRRDFAKRLAILPQERPTPDISVFDLVASGRFPYLDLARKLSPLDIQAVEDALASTDIEKFREKSVRALSGGERQRAYIAMLRTQNTPHILLDEPTAHLDAFYTLETMKLLLKLKDEGRCVASVIHDIPLALKYADEIIVIKDGRVWDFGDAEHILKTGAVEEAFGVACKRTRVDGEDIYFLSDKN